ncbi:Crotonobetainyl-CoA:carnitine CoA-transferase CaiB [Alteribacillus persepolensis]|uniref:Crotonobetainyl-CoA:carnitine CoA-transferase CaiB n=2 Tax=Alteribacillus persepolensis TaxID=568899 RepID=A0A1G8AW70_9BACI|nr:Crotonobetainyl-CoA:carnitine CoA-transferase CaiB [Alteribacillus persepolensis]
MQPLEGVRVLDLSHVLAGPYCTMVLGDMGAEVIKVEQYPEGDLIRQMAPFQSGMSYGFSVINRNKQGIRLDLTTEEGQEVFYRLAKTADVIVENYRPGVTKKLGIDYETIKEKNPDIIYCSISGFGQTGPYKHKAGLDIMAQGMSGIMSMTGESNGRPVKVGVPVHDIGAGITALYHILFAYIYKLKHHEGQYIDVSLVDSALAWTVWEAAAYFGKGEIPVPSGSRHRRIAPYQAYKTQSGFILLGIVNERMWERFCHHVVERPQWQNDPRFATGNDRIENVEELEKEIEAVLTTQPSDVWLKRLEKQGVPCGPILNYEETLHNEQTQHREMVIDYDHPEVGLMKTLGFPAKMSKSPAEFRLPAPMLGQHTDHILEELDYSKAEIERLKHKAIV